MILDPSTPNRPKRRRKSGASLASHRGFGSWSCHALLKAEKEKPLPERHRPGPVTPGANPERERQRFLLFPATFDVFAAFAFFAGFAPAPAFAFGFDAVFFGDFAAAFSLSAA